MISIYYQTTFICSYTWSNYRYKWIRGVDRIAKWICLKNLTFPMGIKTFFGNETVDNDQVVVKWFAFFVGIWCKKLHVSCLQASKYHLYVLRSTISKHSNIYVYIWRQIVKLSIIYTMWYHYINNFYGCNCFGICCLTANACFIANRRQMVFLLLPTWKRLAI